MTTNKMNFNSLKEECAQLHIKHIDDITGDKLPLTPEVYIIPKPNDVCVITTGENHQFQMYGDDSYASLVFNSFGFKTNHEISNEKFSKEFNNFLNNMLNHFKNQYITLVIRDDYFKAFFNDKTMMNSLFKYEYYFDYALIISNKRLGNNIYDE